MSLFFEDEIEKVKRKMDRQGLENLLSQDPRNHRNWSDGNRYNSFGRTFTRRQQRDSESRSDNWWD